MAHTFCWLLAAIHSLNVREFIIVDMSLSTKERLSLGIFNTIINLCPLWRAVNIVNCVGTEPLSVWITMSHVVNETFLLLSVLNWVTRLVTDWCILGRFVLKYTSLYFSILSWSCGTTDKLHVACEPVCSYSRSNVDFLWGVRNDQLEG